MRGPWRPPVAGSTAGVPPTACPCQPSAQAGSSQRPAAFDLYPVLSTPFRQANGDWTTVFIPWHEFVLVKRARSVPDYPPLDPSRIRQFGLVLSR